MIWVTGTMYKAQLQAIKKASFDSVVQESKSPSFKIQQIRLSCSSRLRLKQETLESPFCAQQIQLHYQQRALKLLSCISSCTDTGPPKAQRLLGDWDITRIKPFFCILYCFARTRTSKSFGSSRKHKMS